MNGISAKSMITIFDEAAALPSIPCVNKQPASERTELREGIVREVCRNPDPDHDYYQCTIKGA